MYYTMLVLKSLSSIMHTHFADLYTNHWSESIVTGHSSYQEIQ